MPINYTDDAIEEIEGVDYNSPLFDDSRREQGLVLKTVNDERSMLEATGLFLKGVAAQTVDTFASLLPGIDEDYIDQVVEAQDSELAQFMADNSGSIGFVSDVAGSILPGGLAVKMVRSARVANNAAQNVFKGGAGDLFSTGASNSQLFKPVYAKARAQMLKGENLTDFRATNEFIGLQQKYINRSTKDVLVENLAADIAISLAMQNSDTMFNEEASFVENAAMFGAFNIAFGIGGRMAAKFTMARGLQRVARDVKAKVLNSEGIALDQMSSAGQRGLVIAAGAQLIESYNRALADDSISAASKSTFQAAKSSMQALMAVELEKAAGDSVIAGVTSKWKVGAEHKKTLQNVAEVSGADAYLGLRDLSPLQEELSIAEVLALNTTRLRTDLRVKREKIDLHKKTGRVNAKMEAEVRDLEERIAQDERSSAIVFEIDGSISALTGRKSMFQDGAREIKSLVDGSKSLIADALQIIVHKTGAVELPASETKGVLKLAPSHTASDGSAIALDIGIKETELIKLASDSAGAALIPSSIVLDEFRNELPAVFTVYATKAGSSVYSPTKKGKYSVPVVLAREQVVGLTKKASNIIATPSSFSQSTKENFASLTFKQQTAIWDGLRKSLDDFNIETVEGLKVTNDMHHTQLDYIAQLLDGEGGKAVFDKLNTSSISPQALQSELEWQSLRSKFVDYQKFMNLELKKQALAAKNMEFYDLPDMNEIAKRLNLDNSNDSILQIFQRLRVEDEIVNLDSFFKSKYEFRDAVGQVISRMPGKAQKYTGGMLKMTESAKPVVGIIANLTPMQGVVKREHLVEQAIQSRMTVLNTMERSALADLDGNAAIIVPMVANESKKQTGLLNDVKKFVHSLMQGAQAYGVLGKNFQTQMFKNRLDPAVQAVSRYSAMVSKLTQTSGIEEQIIKPHQAVFRAIMDRGNEGDFAAYSVVRNALSAGWEVERNVVKGKIDGKAIIQWKLKDTVKNREIWRNLARTSWKNAEAEMPTDALVPISQLDHTPATASPTAYEAVNSINVVQQQILTERNALRAAEGMPPLARQAWHMPVAALNQKHVVFLLDDKNRVARTVAGATPREAVSLAAEEVKLWAKSGIQLTTKSEEQIEVHKRAFGDIYSELQNFARPDIQTGTSKGSLASPVIVTDPRHLKADIETMIADLGEISRAAQMKILEPELRQANFQKAMLATTGGFGKDAKDTVYDDFIFAAKGVQRIDDASVIGRGLGAVENSYNSAMKAWYDSRFGSRANLSSAQKRRAKKQFESLQDRLPEQFMPASDYNDYLEKTAQLSLPRSMTKDMGNLNGVVAAAAIRIFDVGMATINVLSLAVTLPPVMMALQRQKGENLEEQLVRVGIHAEVTPEGIARLNPVNTAISATHWMFSKEGQAHAAFAKARGSFQQAAAEQVELYSRTGEEFFTGMLRNFVDTASYLTDKTEGFSRYYSYMNFAYIGKKVLNLDDHAVAVFATQQADNVIADFRPSNRPLLFQGAAGMPIGLFTTYMWNYLQRMYSMVESGSTQLLGAQVALQSAFFGAETVPGVPQYIELFSSNYDGSTNLVDTMNEKFGPEVASFLLKGSVASLTGISVGPRASVGLPGTRANPLDSNFYIEAAPAFSMAKKVYEIVGSVFDNMKETGNFNPEFLAAAYARANINKGTSNLIEVAQGYSEDTRGNLLESNLQEQTMADVGIYARAAGFKPLYVESMRNENRRNAKTDALRNELKARLGKELQFRARSGSLGSVELESALDNYIRAGGQPENFAQFFKSQVVKANENLLNREIATALKASHDDGRLARLLMIMQD